MPTKICLDCKQEFSLNSFGANGKLPSGVPKLKPRCHKCEAVYNKENFYRKVFEIVGGEENYKCCKCGYNKYRGALEFHHLDPVTKDHNLAMMQNYSKAALKEEIDKCILVCANCHRELHRYDHK